VERKDREEDRTKGNKNKTRRGVESGHPRRERREQRRVFPEAVDLPIRVTRTGPVPFGLGPLHVVLQPGAEAEGLAGFSTTMAVSSWSSPPGRPVPCAVEPRPRGSSLAGTADTVGAQPPVNLLVRLGHGQPWWRRAVSNAHEFRGRPRLGQPPELLQDVEGHVVGFGGGTKVRSDIVARNGNSPVEAVRGGERFDHRRRQQPAAGSVTVLDVCHQRREFAHREDFDLRPRGGGRRWSAMPKFVIERPLPGAGDLGADQLQAISQKSNEVLDGMAGRAQWLQSYVTGDKIYCVYIRRRRGRRPRARRRRRVPLHGGQPGQHDHRPDHRRGLTAAGAPAAATAQSPPPRRARAIGQRPFNASSNRPGLPVGPRGGPSAPQPADHEVADLVPTSSTVSGPPGTYNRVTALRADSTELRATAGSTDRKTPAATPAVRMASRPPM